MRLPPGRTRRSSAVPSTKRRTPQLRPVRLGTRSVPSPGSNAFVRLRHRRATPTHTITDRESVRAFVDADPIGNAIGWDRILQLPSFEGYAAGSPTRGVLSVQQPR